MYIKINKTKFIERPWGKDTLVTHIWLYKEDWKFVKRIEHTEELIKKICDIKINIEEKCNS